MKDTREIRFTKMEGAGNDYIYIEEEDILGINPSLLAMSISNRHFGVGADGLVIICPSETADFKMRIFNSDGSEAQMCGNASRCIGKYVYENKLTDKGVITLETLSGIKTLHLVINDDKVKEVTVDMQSPVLDADKIPVIPIEAGVPLCYAKVDDYVMACIGMGNPHGVIFMEELTDSDITGKGPVLENGSCWPENANIEFVKVIDRKNLEMRVWERGSGETLACGTGACASVVASVLEGYTDRTVNVHLRGGILKIFWDEKSNHIFMTGPARTVCTGYYFYQTPE